VQAHKVFIPVVVVIIVSCGPVYTPAVPDRTSYPLGILNEQRITMSVEPVTIGGRTQITTNSSDSPLYESSIERKDALDYAFDRITEGDTSEHAVWAIPDNRSQFSEESLFEIAHEQASKICKEQFYILDTNYYFGDEATIKMMGIETPALKASVRCPIGNAGRLNEMERAIRNYSVELGDIEFFDYLEKSFEIPKDNFLSNLSKVLKDKKMPIIKQKVEGNRTFILAGQQLSEQKFGRMERLAVIIEGNERESVIGFILTAYRYTHHKRGVLTHDVKQTGVAPWDRKTAFGRAQDFLGLLNAGGA